MQISAASRRKRSGRGLIALAFILQPIRQAALPQALHLGPGDWHVELIIGIGALLLALIALLSERSKQKRDD